VLGRNTAELAAVVRAFQYFSSARCRTYHRGFASDATTDPLASRGTEGDPLIADGFEFGDFLRREVPEAIEPVVCSLSRSTIHAVLGENAPHHVSDNEAIIVRPGRGLPPAEHERSLRSRPCLPCGGSSRIITGWSTSGACARPRGGTCAAAGMNWITVSHEWRLGYPPLETRGQPARQRHAGLSRAPMASVQNLVPSPLFPLRPRIAPNSRCPQLVHRPDAQLRVRKNSYGQETSTYGTNSEQTIVRGCVQCPGSPPAFAILPFMTYEPVQLTNREIWGVARQAPGTAG
jgi:hypothetical protein